MNSLDAVVAAQKKGEPNGLTSICSAHPVVLDAAMRHARVQHMPILIEATCNQVNQFGGYTGMTPGQFVSYLLSIADKNSFPHDQLIMGGDHLGPLVWENEPADSAMAKARGMVHEYVSAGFKKIHLDCSMPCADDRSLTVDVIAHRTAELAKVAEETSLQTNPNLMALPRYVIGSEVPTAGGAHAGETHIHITNPASVAETIDLTKKAFAKLGLESAWERVIAVVVQPGVEFGDEEIHAYNRAEATDLARFIETVPGLIYEAHSTDYQTREDLRALVEDHYGLLKVGPALTFAFREAVFALAEIEEIEVEGESSNIRNVLEGAMLADPTRWQKHYGGSSHNQKISRFYSYSDRIRYYWNTPAVEKAFEQLLNNLGKDPLPLSLLSQYLPTQYEKIRQGVMVNSAYELILGQITDVLEDYRFACGG